MYIDLDIIYCANLCTYYKYKTKVCDIKILYNFHLLMLTFAQLFYMCSLLKFYNKLSVL